MAPETDDQTTMWKEIDEGDAKEKAVFLAAKRYAKAKADRDALLGDSKEKCDGLMDKLIGAMHEADMLKFRHKGVEAEIFERSERVVVKVGEEDENGDGEDDDA